MNESTDICRFRQLLCRLTPLLQGTPANIRINLMLPKKSRLELATFLLLTVWVYRQIFVACSERPMFFETECVRSSKAVDFGINRKSVYNFLLVINSNLCPILPRFRDTAGFLLTIATLVVTHPYSTRTFGMFPLE